MARLLKEQKEENLQLLSAYTVLLEGLKKVTESLHIKYDYIPEVKLLQALFDLAKIMALKQGESAFKEGRELLKDPNNPEVIASYAEIQAIVEPH